MKKAVFFLLAAVLCVAACQEYEDISSVISDDVLSAQIEEGEMTKTILSESNDILWSEGDQILVFMKTSLGLQYQLQDEYIGKSYGYFSKISTNSGDDLGIGMEWDHIVAYYPYSKTVECEKSDDEYVLDVVLPSEQTYVAESFANGSFPMVAVSEDTDITIKNVCGGMKLQLMGKQNVVSVKVEGKNNEKLSGAATVTAYTDDLPPAITMIGADDASKSVTLNCGEGVQLNESTATEFIIVLPPVLFSQGFTVTVTDSENETYTVETDKANTVLRSSLLVMPVVKIGETPEVEEDDETVVPVSNITLNTTSLTLPTSFSYTLTTTIAPSDATVQTANWSSSDASVATVDQNGVVITISDGTAIITAEADGLTATCSFTVIAPTTTEPKDYIMDGINYGKGIVIGDNIWAPVNCGYHAADFPYGKHYQWGRRYGHGLSGIYDSYDLDYLIGPVSYAIGQDEEYADCFIDVTESPYDWISTRDDALWNSGSEENPIKTDNDPCPEGWRVPTHSELKQLSENHSRFISSEEGMYFSGAYTYVDGVPQVFLSASSCRMNSTDLYFVGNYGDYWTITPNGNEVYYLYFDDYNLVYPSKSQYRKYGSSVRCLQVIDEVAEP